MVHILMIDIPWWFAVRSRRLVVTAGELEIMFGWSPGMHGSFTSRWTTGHITRLIVSSNNVEVYGVPVHVLDMRLFSCRIRGELSNIYEITQSCWRWSLQRVGERAEKNYDTDECDLEDEDDLFGEDCEDERIGKDNRCREDGEEKSDEGRESVIMWPRRQYRAPRWLEDYVIFWTVFHFHVLYFLWIIDLLFPSLSDIK